MSFQELDIMNVDFNPFKKIGSEWFLVTAGTEGAFNTMTASWGSMGVLWGKPVFNTVVRTSRYTFQFMEEQERFSICFFDQTHRKDLSYCGSHSGRNEDKIAHTSLTPTFIDGVPAFEEAKTVFLCRKLFRSPFTEENFIDKSLLEFYKSEGFHVNFTGEIYKAYTK